MIPKQAFYRLLVLDTMLKQKALTEPYRAFKIDSMFFLVKCIPAGLVKTLLKRL